MNKVQSAQKTIHRELSKRKHACFAIACSSIGFFILFLLFLCPHVAASTSDYDSVSLPYGEVTANDIPFPDPDSGFTIVNNPLPFSGVLTIQPYYVHGETETDEAIPEDISDLWTIQLANANQIFNGIGISIESGNLVRIPEKQVDGIDPGIFDEKKKNAHLKQYHEDHKSIVEEAVEGQEPSEWEVAPVFLIDRFDESSSSLFYQLIYDTSGQTVTIWMAGKNPNLYDTKQSGCFIAYGHEINWDTLAHELGHLLLNDRFFYRSATNKDGKRHHLSGNSHLMSLDRITSIIDFQPVVKDKFIEADMYTPNVEVNIDSIENIRKSRMNHIEAMYYRTPYVRREDFPVFGPTYLNIFMPSFYETYEETDDANVVFISIQLEHEDIPQIIPATILWGGNQQSWRLCEHWLLEQNENKLSLVDIADIKISGWARLVSESTDEEVEYCIDLYFSEPFYYYRYQSHKMVPDQFGSEPYFGLLCSTIGPLQSHPEYVQVFGYRELEESESRLTDIKQEEIKPTPIDTNPFPSLLWLQLKLSDLQGISQLRLIYRMPKFMFPDFIVP